MNISRYALTALVCASGIVHADTPGIPLGNDEACLDGPLAQFGRYLGDWKIDDEQLARDGSGWSPAGGARWIFVCVGNGTAVQDFWIKGDSVGTNLRTYNPATEAWEIVWTVPSLEGQAHIRAVPNDEGDIVMNYVSPEQDPPRRITFHKPTDDGWRWKLEFSFDDGDTWTEVYRIRATPWE